MRSITVPHKAYKFMKPCFLRKLETTKKIFVNHLNNYPESRHGSVIGDDLEGHASKNVTLNSHIFTENDLNTPLGAHLSQFFNFEGVSNIQLTGGNFITEEVDDNCYVYCLCEEYDDYVKKEFGGSCLIIENFPQFLTELNKCMLRKKKFLLTAAKCTYLTDREQKFEAKDPNFNIIPGLIKDIRYKNQKEYRVLWKNIDNSLIDKPLEIYCPSALKYCRFEY
ncbi:hypothetical protein ABE189_03310 [Bacillus subtilis]|uniref:hypothetical protein n=1 Tax=Bacillus subtilis TaxID=1423 RepID=UPI001009BB8D|nr:hypothetical protein [Bacillus subtilis]QAW17379.1 hypothetical protein ETA19_13335 [Bacillus subtilis]QAW21463.1 hypothetical protein ETA18_13335 [Bacillus subtilis]CAF1855271.1 hypothetical protein NRS6141_04302 [Bacillus subtilis]CAF1880405.1 hypothetical protein NRS6204_00608 [Bacillus subtilis]CAF1918708.1 hypothetical protein NRS6205_04302 [Bacillus subtilis]